MTGKHTLSDNDIAYVKELAQKAGRLAMAMRSGVTIREKTGPHDIVTAADLELSDLIVKGLKQRFERDVIVSEEDEIHAQAVAGDRVWLVDPIDGTDNYVSNDGQYSVMIGVLEQCQPTFGWVFAPCQKICYWGGPIYGAWKQFENDNPKRYQTLSPQLNIDNSARIMMGFRDRRSHPWVKDHPKVVLVKAGSIGLKVAKVLEDEADLFVHLSGKLKAWDTAGPSAIALGGQLEVGTLDTDELVFPLPGILHTTSVIIGRPGSLHWARTYLKQQSTDLPLTI